MKRHTVLGTGGHIDHGKTALVKALTGTDTDRLAVEKERGITTDLGFAFLGSDITIIDVPGHEKFVRTMVAGVSTIDISMLVVAADDGVMPQTVEHLDVLRYLNVKKGLIALNKKDLVDADWLELVTQDVRNLVAGTFLEGAKIIPVSAITGEGVEEIRQEILRLAQEIPAHPSDHVFRFPIDRAFTMKGFGTVVTGTILSGKVRVGDHLELQPQQLEVRVRGLQVHESAAAEAFAGQRVGINIMNVGKEQIERGNVLVAPGFYKPSYMLDVRLSVSRNAQEPVKHWQRIRFHIGTSEIYARVVPLEGDQILPGASAVAQLRLESPTIAECHDRFVIRQHAPAMTIGGGEILEPYPVKHKQLTPELQTQLEGVEAGDPHRQVEAVFAHQPLVPLRFKEIQEGARVEQDVVQTLVQDLVQQGVLVQLGGKMETLYVTASDLQAFYQKVRALLQKMLGSYPFLEGVELNELKEQLHLPLSAVHVEVLLQALAAQRCLVQRGTQWSLPDHQPAVSADDQAILDRMRSFFAQNPFRAEVEASFYAQFGRDLGRTHRLFSLLETKGEAIRLAEGLFISGADYARGLQVVQELGKGGQEIRVGDVRERLDTTRKFAMPFMQYLDDQGITLRAGDRRLLRGKSQEVSAHDQRE